MDLGRHASANAGGICKLLIYRICDESQLNIFDVSEDEVEFSQDPNLMCEVIPDSGIYREPDNVDENGTSYNYQIDFTVAKDRVAQRQFTRKFRNVNLGVFVQNKNKNWKHYRNLTLRSNVSSGRNNADLNNHSYTLFSNSIEQSKFASIANPAIFLTTNWNEAIQGNFIASLSRTGSDIPTWTFPSGLQINSTNVNTSGTGLNGSTQTVKIEMPDFADIIGFSLSNTGLCGIANFSLVSFNGSLIISSNPNLDDISLSDTENNIIGFQADNTNFSGTLNLSRAIISGTFSILNTSVTKIIHSNLSSPNQINNLYRATGVGLQEIEFNNSIMDGSGDTIRLDGNGMSTLQADTMFARIDAIAQPGTNVIRMDGNNPPTGGLSNANVLSLLGKGYSVVL